MILPRNLAENANSIMNFELSEDKAEAGDGVHKSLESALSESNIDELLGKLSVTDTLSKLLLLGWHTKLTESNRSPLLEYDSIIAAYHKLQGPLEWRNCGNCFFSVALFREEQFGS